MTRMSSVCKKAMWPPNNTPYELWLINDRDQSGCLGGEHGA